MGVISKGSLYKKTKKNGYKEIPHPGVPVFLLLESMKGNDDKVTVLVDHSRTFKLLILSDFRVANIIGRIRLKSPL